MKQTMELWNEIFPKKYKARRVKNTLEGPVTPDNLILLINDA